MSSDRRGRPALVLAFDRRAISWAEGLRAALSVALIVGANLWLNWPPLIEAALGALLTCLCDAGGPIRRRVPAVLAFAFLGAAITGGIGLARAQGLAVVLPAATLCLFCTSYARVYGQSAMQVGNLLGVVLVLALDRSLDLAEATVLSASFLGGGLWAAVLTLVIWRLRPFLPARRAVAACYLALGALVGDLRGLVAPHASAEQWDAHARAHRRQVRDAIEAARTTVLETVRSRGASGGRAAQTLLRLEAADQMFGLLIALSDLAEQGHDAAETGRLLRRLRPVLAVLARTILADRPPKGAGLERAVAGMTEEAARLPDDDPLHRIADGIVERVRIAATLSIPADYDAEVEGPVRLSLRALLLRPLRANWNWQSLVLRHAVRLAVVAIPAVAFTVLYPGPYEHWLTITMLVTMQPYFAMTFTRALERIGGTMLGGLVAAVIGLVCDTPAQIAAALVPLLLVAMALRQVNFGLFIMALTPPVVLLSELGRPGTSEWVIAALRAGYTLAGGLLALAGCYLLWPSWEPVRLREEVRRAIAAHAAYADRALAEIMGEAASGEVDRARRAAGLATNNVEASLSRTLLEPDRLSGERLEAAMLIDASLRRMAGRLAAMRMDPGVAGSLPRGVWAAWRDWIVRSAGALDVGAAAPASRPKLEATGPAADALRRIARQIELMAGALGRLA